MYRFGIIGCGTVAGIHAAAIESMDQAELAGVFDPVPAKAEAFAAENGTAVYDSLEKMLADPSIDIVNICTPSSTHASLAIQAARAGKHVVIEKPVATSLEEADAVVRTVTETGVKAAVISQLRFASDVQRLHQAIQQKALGKIVLASLSMRYSRDSSYYQKKSWRGQWKASGGGALMNQGIHGVDLLCYLCGPVKKVHAFSKTLVHPIEVEDTLCSLLEYESGAMGVLEVTTAVHPGRARVLVVSGTKGDVTLTEETVTEWNGMLPLESTGHQWKMDTANDPASVGSEGHRLQLENMLRAIEGKEDLLVDAKTGRDTVAVILAMYQSAKSGESVCL